MKCEGCGREFLTGQAIVTVRKLQPDQRSGLSKLLSERRPDLHRDYSFLCVCDNCLGRYTGGGWEVHDRNRAD